MLSIENDITKMLPETVHTQTCSNLSVENALEIANDAIEMPILIDGQEDTVDTLLQSLAQSTLEILAARGSDDDDDDDDDDDFDDDDFDEDEDFEDVDIEKEFEEFDMPKSKKSGGKKSEDDDDFGLDDEFGDLGLDDDFDDEDDDF